MKSTIKKSQSEGKIIFDTEFQNKTYTQIAPARRVELEKILNPIFEIEIEKIKNGTSDLLK